MSPPDDPMIAAMRSTITAGIMAQVATLDDAALRELVNLMHEMARSCERELADRMLARSAPAGRG